MPRRDHDDDYGVDREILDIIPERFDADPDSRYARKSALVGLIWKGALALIALSFVGVTVRHILFGEAPHAVQQAGAPIIHADDKPIKVKPQDPGGMDVPNQDKLVYERMGADGTDKAPERLLPPPEQPQLPPDQPRTPSIRPAFSGNGGVISPPPTTPAATEPPTESPPAPAATAAMTAPAAVAGAATTAAMVAKPATPPAANPTMSPIAPIAPPHKAGMTAKAPPPPAPAKASPPPAKPAAMAVAAPTPTPATVSAPAPAVTKGGGGWLVQLGALRSDADAKSEWARIRGGHKELLGALNSDVIRVDLGEKGIFWRLRAGPLDEAQARTLCSGLIKQGQGCIVVRQ